MAAGLSRDSLAYERHGRIVGEEHHRAAIRARVRELLRVGTGGAGGRSTQPVTARASGGKPRSNETVLKVISWTKAKGAPLAQARYAARMRDDDAPERALPMVNEAGRELRSGEIADEVRSWALKPDSENLSPAARAATPAERVAMPARERLQRRQAVHMIFSVPAHARADAARLRSAVELALAETAGQGGFRYLATVHTDHSSRPHAHIIIKAQSEPIRVDGRTRTTQLRLGPRELEAMRQVFTRHAQEQGLNVVATRREDRAQLRADILEGRAPLRYNMNLHQAMKQTRQGRTFERRAPDWYAEHGFAYERRRLAAASVEHGAVPIAEAAPSDRSGGLLGRVMRRLHLQRKENVSTPQDPVADTAGRRRGGYFSNFENYRNGAAAAGARVIAHFAATHLEPERAAESFHLMLREAPRLALWAANNHPSAFGEPTGANGPGLAAADFRQAIRAAEQRTDCRQSVVVRTDDPILAGERSRLREATAGARAGRRGGIALAVTHSIDGVASRLERDVADPDAQERAGKLRELARSQPITAAGGGEARALAPDRAHAPAQDGHGERERPITDKAGRYEQLEEQLKRRDAARARGRGQLRENGRHQ